MLKINNKWLGVLIYCISNLGRCILAYLNIKFSHKSTFLKKVEKICNLLIESELFGSIKIQDANKAFFVIHPHSPTL